MNLEGAAKMWPTPRKADLHGSSVLHGDGGLDLRTAVEFWGTPNAKIAEDSQTHRSGARSGELLLTGQAKAWATPTTRDWKSEDPAQSPDHSPPLGRQVLQTEPDGKPGSPRAVLNPYFVEALMGLPPSWTVPTGFNASGMPSFQPKPKRRSRCSRSES